MRVCVVGVGNIGLNLLQSLRRAGVEAVGLDISEQRVRELAEQQVAGVFRDSAQATDVDVWIITTSTGPGQSHLLGAAASINPKNGALISVESTLPVGTMAKLTDHFTSRGYAVGSDLFLAHVPHRILFGVEQSVFDAARIVAGVTPQCLTKAMAFYAPLVTRLHPVPDVRIAELAKIIENALRFVDIAFAEGIFQYCQEQGIDYRQLREAVNTKANVQLLDVDFGIGGECLPKDIRFLQAALHSPLLEGAMAVEDSHRAFLRALAEGQSRILVKGLSFKPGHPDTRFSMAMELVRGLQADGKQIYVYDPMLTPETIERNGLTWGDPDDDYDLIYERPLAVMAGKEAVPLGEDPRHGKQGDSR